MNFNPYVILQVDSTCDDKEIKRAYRALAKVAHPDRGGNAKKFDEITQAYQFLNDSNRRAEYDRSLLVRSQQETYLSRVNSEYQNSHLPSFTVRQAFKRMVDKNYTEANLKDEFVAFKSGSKSPSSTYYSRNSRRFSFHYSQWFNPSIVDEFMISDYVANIAIMFPLFLAARIFPSNTHFRSLISILLSVILPAVIATFAMIYFIKWRKTWKKFGILERVLLITICLVVLQANQGLDNLVAVVLWYLALSGILRSYADVPTRPAQIFSFLRNVYDKI